MKKNTKKNHAKKKKNIVLIPSLKNFQNRIFRTFGSQVFVSKVLNFPSYVYLVIHHSTYMYSSV